MLKRLIYFSIFAALVVLAVREVPRLSLFSLVGGKIDTQARFKPAVRLRIYFQVSKGATPEQDVWSTGICAGFLISPTEIVTAAHCFFSQKTSNPPSKIFYYDEITKKWVQTKPPVIHPSFQMSNVNKRTFDFALLRVSTPSKLDKFFPLCSSTNLDRAVIVGFQNNNALVDGQIPEPVRYWGEAKINAVTSDFIVISSNKTNNPEGDAPMFELGDSGAPILQQVGEKDFCFAGLAIYILPADASGTYRLDFGRYINLVKRSETDGVLRSILR